MRNSNTKRGGFTFTTRANSRKLQNFGSRLAIRHDIGRPDACNSSDILYQPRLRMSMSSWLARTFHMTFDTIKRLPQKLANDSLCRVKTDSIHR